MSANVPANALVVVADGAKALFYRNKGSQTDIKLVLQDKFAQGDLGDLDSQAPTGHSAPAHLSPNEDGEAAFAKQLADRLSKDAVANRYDALVLIADAQTLGQIRKSLHKAVETRIVRTMSKDYTHQSSDEIAKALG